MSEDGRIFENKIHSIISQSLYTVYREKDIRSIYGSNISGIDHLIIGGDICIGIQDKYVKCKKPCIVDVNHFKACISDLSKITGKKILGIYLSLLEPTSPAKKSIELENIFSDNYFIFINEKDENLLINKLIKTLYNYEVYLYDSDSDLQMIE